MPTELELQEMDLFTRRRRRRNIALGAALAAFVLVFYVLTFVKMGLYHTL